MNNQILVAYIDRQKSEALAEYITKCAEAEELLEHLTAYIEDHGEVAPDDVTWAHVGSMAYVVELLREVKSYIRNKEER